MTRFVVISTVSFTALFATSYALTRRAVSRLLEHGPHSWGVR